MGRSMPMGPASKLYDLAKAQNFSHYNTRTCMHLGNQLARQ
jgi:hypothetical protein